MNPHSQQYIRSRALKLGFAVRPASGLMRALSISRAILFAKMLLVDQLEEPAEKLTESLVTYGENQRCVDCKGHTAS